MAPVQDPADALPSASSSRPPLADSLTGTSGEILLVGLDIDGLVLHDIDDESDRNPEQRPFPYLPTMDPTLFHAEYLSAWRKPVVVYRCVGKYPEADLSGWLRTVDAGQVRS